MIRGVFLSDSGIQGETSPDFASAVLRTTTGGTAPLLALSSGMQARDLAGTWSTMWFDEEHSTGRLAAAATQANGAATALSLTDGSSVVPGQFYLVEKTGERIFVTDVSGNTLTVVRGFQDTGASAAAIATGDYIQRIGTAFSEASEAPTAVYEQGIPYWNVTQIFRTAWDVSNTTSVITYKTGDKVANSRAQAAFTHAEDIERTLWFGRRWVASQGGKRIATMGGVDYYNTQNITNIATGTASTYASIDAFLSSVFLHQIQGKPQERLAFCGNTAVGVLNAIAKSNTTMNIVPGATTFGMKVFQWISPYGQISLMTHPMFNANPTWSKDLRILHPGAMTVCYLRRTKEYTVGETGRDAKAGGFTTEMTTEFRCPKTAGALRNINLAG